MFRYTAANWSGRMPCDEVADAIVSKGRETLENAIKYVNENGKNKYAGARVVCFVSHIPTIFVISDPFEIKISVPKN